MLEEEDLLELLKLLSLYDLLLEQLQKSLSEGFSLLGRANYHNKDSLRGRYGRDYWDESYEGQLMVKSGKELMISRRMGQGGTQETPKEEKSLRRRCEKPISIENTPKPRDPIYMFGGVLSTPTSLRQSQSHFKSSIPLMTELLNCRRRIEKLITTRG
ncbi:VMA22 (YHR060W) [Zygosaccharomyces parabailii]|uniref:Vacuolar ATPase assembly protein VMA22 n=1 Tax=Zygosaccharomyces bailii (strain CLIB 213 / ATCC 58445 / CBS 680 / BCRC 21525 / NBRC 1098 / NCYC 1416 / NRRL Y-2227) TaxID=1333698 RepID=A0A8J2T449_ZYGB2|nr:VMA22 (YHR060W) [Zygosaccharomyces parabailii]CDF87934.1 BN860_17788g1_1 [Zygosaccharomyces bailii CLIB 213]CDH17990.1 related to Vacuolar ATPase assembly protein VMA22 [Zygosaccharomyces bailii ISA1307]SJM83790.1 related to Vacuolar ATPase assembly protein VMA22 [Zygosaccharomyces bailii]